MVAYLEKSDENAEFHQIVDFLSTCSINYALTVSPTIYASYIEQFWNTATSKTVNSVKQIHAIVDGKAVVIIESSVRNDLLFDDEDGITCLTNDEIFENLALMGYEQLSTKLTFQKEPQTELLQTETPPTVSHEPQTEANIEQILPSPSIYQRKHRKTQKHRRAKKVTELPQTSMPLDLGADEAVHKEGVTVWQSQAPRNHGGAPAQTRSERVLKQPNEPPLPEGHTSRSGEGRMEHTFELMDIVPPTPHDSPLPGGYTPGSDEGRLKLEELMAMCTKLSKQVLDLEKEKDAQAVEILKLKKRVKKLERQRKSSILNPRKVDIQTKPMFKDSDFDDLDDLVDEGMAFVQEKDAENQGKIGADNTEVVTQKQLILLTLIKMKEEKAKEKGVAIKDVEDSSRPIRSITTLQPLPTIDPKDKERDAEVALRLQAKLDEELRVERERQEEASKVAIAEMFDEVQARIDADYELAARMTQDEQEKYTIEERARLLAEFFERRKKQLAAERAEAIRNKPPTKTQLRNLMMIYLKNMGGYKHSQLKEKSNEEIQGLYERQQKRIQDFTPINSEKEAQKSGKRLKRVAGSYATQKSPKKPKVMKFAKDVTEEETTEYEKEKEELRLSLKIISNDDSEVNYEPLSKKFPIVNWEYQLLGKMEEKDIVDAAAKD
ncbi:hypothetical protein Tco_1368222 [Tanacetum coccineum]